MMNPKKSFLPAVLVIATGIFLSACYYDNEEYLYPDNGGTSGCDTINVSYSLTVAPILATHCNGCHNPANPSYGVITSVYNDLMIQVNNGRFWGSINHETGYYSMPKNGNKLSNCNLLKIRKWINNGALND